jgi:hypothetical protein
LDFLGISVWFVPNYHFIHMLMHIIIVKIWNISFVFQTLGQNHSYYDPFLIKHFVLCFICLLDELFPLRTVLTARLFRNVLAWVILIVLHSFSLDLTITSQRIFIFRCNLRYPFQACCYFIRTFLVFLLKCVHYFAFNLSLSIIHDVFLYTLLAIINVIWCKLIDWIKNIFLTSTVIGGFVPFILSLIVHNHCIFAPFHLFSILVSLFDP